MNNKQQIAILGLACLLHYFSSLLRPASFETALRYAHRRDLTMPRAAFPPPTHADGAVHISGPRQIAFWHPGYATPPATPFLVLAAYEASTFHHETARLACAGIANNRTDGFLSTDVEGRSPVGSDPDLQLALDNYYFQVPDSRSEDWQNVVGSSGTDKSEESATLCKTCGD